MTKHVAAAILIGVSLDLPGQGPPANAQETVVQFVSGTRARSIPFELFANVIFLRVRVGDSDQLNLFAA